MKRLILRLLPMLVVTWLSLVACHKPKPALEMATPTDQQKQAASAARVPESTQRHWTFLNRIRQEDSLNTSIARTLVDDQNQLGFVFYSRVAPDKVPGLVRQVMEQMAQEFPKEDITLSVYGAGSPPRKIGTAHLDGQTEESIYTPKNND